ncbi:phosphoinositide 3-kinase adapter protein 1 isoform X2 [Nematostella vectensis]|uniref:phosphoinositide 3-kinase adapter protein 1 isoform X2 n=1 Tax=Nematostella vectensis TaxID=45351 RepID=UPI0020772D35|nr:phosphoinositide 3-kinase adapter protein 1 isoform X2 [Nematostella vectensis]
MYSHQSAESGIDTDYEAKEKPSFIHVIPDKIRYDSQQKIALLFDKSLPNKGTFRVDFRGERRSAMQVRAQKVNACTLVVVAPVYFPAEKVHIIARHESHEGIKSLGRRQFEFQPRDSILAELLSNANCAVSFMCESLGISPLDIQHLDEALAVTFRRNMPRGFNLIGLHNNNVDEEASKSMYPTLLHFAAAFGLHQLATECLLECPGAKEASTLRDCHGRTPVDIAREGDFNSLAENILVFQEQCCGSIYEQMENPDEEGPESAGYIDMRPGYINIQLWGPGGTSAVNTIEGEPKQEQELFYEDMNRDQQDQYYEDMQIGAEEDDPGYVHTEPISDEHSHYYTHAESIVPQPGEEVYEDMSEDKPHYTDVPDSGEGEVYEDLSGQEGIPDEPLEEMPGGYHSRPSYAIYDTPSNLPAANYPSSRSASMSIKRPARPERSTAAPSAVTTCKRPPPPVAPRNPPHQIHRTGSMSSRVSSTSTESSSSAASSVTVASDTGYQADQEQDLLMTREQLLESMKEMKSPPEPSPPPLPPQDYEEERSLQSISSLHNKRKVRPRHERSATEPVCMQDVQQAVQRSYPTSSAGTVKSSQGSLKTSPRPPPPRRAASDHPSISLGSLPRRRSSSGEESTINRRSYIDRPPAPPPLEEKTPLDKRASLPPPASGRPPAPIPSGTMGSAVPKSTMGSAAPESIIGNTEPKSTMGNMGRRGSHGQVPTPFLAAMTSANIDDNPIPPPVPRRLASSAATRSSPPQPAARPRPAPRR